ncbi:hypothetical protein J7426_21775 [Tropicibacter sp. R16_0]|uniref:hypothetical protein n=1 Tax=Tropicibacter sp. R16_0 TaxID=2821102 RepID=UPI001ADB3BA4|nr:hypothetical protein [Tropicibacter sp. R16_0]MBO9452908.1 hypothetical protein [Tropicibacter sp. R16_0]
MKLTCLPPEVQSLLNEPRDILLIGMSGIGKTLLSSYLNRSGAWRYVSIDAQIQGCYLREQILEVFINEVSKGAMLSKLQELGVLSLDDELCKDSLAPLTSYLGMPGDPSKGGIEFTEYVKRQNFHRQAELTAVADLLSLSSQRPVLADSSGSFCELFAPGDPIFSALKDRFLIVSLRETDELVQRLIARYVENPKPIYYSPDLLSEYWGEYSANVGGRDRYVDPRKFALWSYQKMISVRRDKFAELARHSDISISAADLRYA